MRMDRLRDCDGRPPFIAPTTTPRFVRIILDDDSRDTKTRIRIQIISHIKSKPKMKLIICNCNKIPTEFVQHFHGNVPHQCHLQTTSQTCLVHVEEVNNKFYFQTGLNDFLQKNRLKYGQLLVFHYAGNSHFNVDIYGKDTSAGYFVGHDNKEPEEEEEEDDVSLEILDDSPTPSTLPQKKYKASSTGETIMKKKEAHWSKSEIKKNDGGGTSVTKRITMQQLWGARLRAEAFKLRNPSAFLVFMKPSYINSKFVWLPSEFTILVKPFIGNSCDVILRVSDGSVRTWWAKLTKSVATNRCKLHGKCWSKFMRDNNIEEGDVCALMLIKDPRVVIKVVIFRANEGATCTFSPDIFDNENHDDDDDGDDEEEEGDDESEDEEEPEDEMEEEGDDESEDEEDTEDEMEEVEEDDESEDEEETEDEMAEEEDDDFSETLNYVPPHSSAVASRLHKRRRIRKISSDGSLSIDEKRLNSLALEKANGFKSDQPSFVVSLCSSYAGGSYLNIPRTFSEKHVAKQRPDYFTLWIQRTKRMFKVKVSYIQRTCRLQAGWFKFARVNKLKLGDVCVFVLSDAKTFVFDVEIIRLTDVGTSSQGNS